MKRMALMKGIVMMLLLVLAACGGGGGTASSGTVVSGVAAAGIMANSTVKVYKVESDGTLTLLTTARTDANGRYSAGIGSYVGAIVVKAFGSYTDEATGSIVTVPEAMALQAALPASTDRSGAVSVSVTPLTDIAVRKAQEAGGLAENIATANQTVSQLFGVDVTSTAPVRMDTSILQNSGVTDAQKRYTAVLATVSQLTANTTGSAAPTVADLQASLARITGGISSAGASAQLAASLQQAVQDVGTNPNTLVLASAASATLSDLASVGSTNGKKIVSYTVRTTGSYTGSVYGVQVTITVPAGISLRTSAGAADCSDVIVRSGNASAAYSAGSISPGTVTFAVVSTEGFGVGEFATFYGEVPAGASAPAASAFGITAVRVLDANGAAIDGAGVEMQ